jgi:hypothetical protein
MAAINIEWVINSSQGTDKCVHLWIYDGRYEMDDMKKS